LKRKVTILGAGSWGLANADLLTRNGASVTTWEFDPEQLRIIRQNRGHPQKLPGLNLDDSINITGDLPQALEGSEIVVFAVPTQKVATVCRALTAARLAPPDLVVNLAKGIEEKTLRRVSEIIGQDWRNINARAIVTISGPSHAEEVARRLPTSVVVAGEENRCRQTQALYSDDTFRVYRSPDLIGVELGGALKNIIAIGAGIAGGLGFGDNTQGALITRGLFEINRLAVTMGADPETLAGLSGVGDLITTCISEHSRNHYVGFNIGRGKTLDEILAGMVMVAEGVTTCRSARALARRHEVEMPITEAVYSVLFENLPPREAVTNLMTRPLKAEVWQ